MPHAARSSAPQPLLASTPQTHSPLTASSDPVTSYARAVHEGRIVAGPHVRAACKRHLDDLLTGHLRGLHFSVEKAKHALGFFPTVLRLNGGQFEGLPFHPHCSQEFIIGSLFGWLRTDGTRRFRVAYIEQGKGNGKALALDTPIPTPSGWTTMGALRAGDVVYGADGKPCTVTHAHPVSIDRVCFEVTFSDGRQIVASAEHLWRVNGQVVDTITVAASLRLGEAQRVDHRRIVACDRVASVPVRCISVSSSDQMFLAGESMVPTHNSPMIAGIGLYCMLADNEPRAEVYSAASKKDQAAILFRDAVAMVDQSPALSKRLKQSGRGDKVNNLYDERTNSFFRPISADDGQSGPRPHVGLIDELHEHRSPQVIQMMSAGRKWRRQPLIIAITNSGTDRKTVCWEYHEKAIKVAAQMEVDDTLFSYVCALDEGDDPFIDETCWEKANPTLGDIITPQYLRDEVNASKGMPSKESSVKRLNFCTWTEAFNPAINYETWQAVGDEYSLAKFRGRSCVAGLDLSATTDLTSIVLDFTIDGVHWLWPMFWIPKEGLAERVKKDGVPYDIWVEKGFVYTTPGSAIDKDFVVAEVAKLVARYDITLSSVPFDPYRIDTIQAACDRQGVTWPLKKHGQGFYSMGPAWDAFEVALVEKKMRHPRNPCFNANAASAVIVSDAAGNRKLDKSKATARIDGIVAATMAVGDSAVTATVSRGPRIAWA